MEEKGIKLVEDLIETINQTVLYDDNEEYDIKQAQLDKMALQNLLKRYKELEEEEMLDKADIEEIFRLRKKCVELEEEIESQDKTIDNLIIEQEEREKYTHSLEEENKCSKETINILTNKLDKVVEDNKELEENYNKLLEGYNKRVEEIIELENNSIPISVIQNKIDELKEQEQELSDDEGYWGSSELLVQIEVLQELLEERNK